jgi:glycosyltransferase involved in cell wall biosynthesis
MRFLGPPLRAWDRRAARRAGRYLANSAEVSRRITKRYGIEAQVVPAPVPELIARATPNVLFLKDISDDALTRLYGNARALIAVAYEDYGLTPVEAAATGTPSIVLRWGGYLDTMVEDVTAVFVDEPTGPAIAEGIARFESRDWDRDAIRVHAQAFTEEVFIKTLTEMVGDAQPTSAG